MNSKEDSIDGTFDIDVVGFTDLHDYKAEEELFDFDSSADYGLFGEKDVYTLGTSSKILINSEKSQNNVVLSKKKRRSKDWNEAEKGLFLTGLAMFGENWKKISKFVATKTPYQVKIYHKLCTETANVIHDTDHSTHDSSICLPIIPEDNNICLGLTDGNDVSFVNESYNASDMPSSSNMTLSIVDNLVLYSSETADEADVARSIAKQNCGDELFVSSLHDWSLGSQVSVIEEITSFNSQEEQKYFHNKPSYLKGTALLPPKSNFKLESNSKSIKSKNNSKLIKKGKKDIMKQSRIVSTTAEKVIDGEVIHLSKGNDVDSDVDIVGSDDEESVNNLDELHDSIGCIDEEFNINISLPGKKFFNVKSFETSTESLTLSEKDFCRTSLGLDKVDSFIVGKQYITKVWSDRKIGSRISLAQVLRGSEHYNINKVDMSKIFEFLEKQGLINCNSERSVHTKRNNSENIEKIKKKFSSKIYKRLGGGVTLSHDSSGCVTNAIHVPENSLNLQSSSKKSKSVSNVVELQQCVKYEHGRSAPFTATVHPSALILLDIHAHSSYTEVMGLLGGYLDLDDSILHITTVVATKSTSSAIDCDMCPLDQKDAVQMIHEVGYEVVGWYHSHPTFLPNPSKRDLESQTQLQDYFQKHNSPFIGLIISPFCTSVFSGASLIRCLILDEQIVGSKDVPTIAPFSLPWKVNDDYDIDYDDIESSVIKLLVKIDSNPNSVKWSKECLNGVSFANVLCQSLLTHIPVNLKSTIHLVKNTLCSNLE